MKASQIMDDNFFKGFDIVEEISFVKDPGLTEFRLVIEKFEKSGVDASPVTKKGSSALYKAFATVDSEHQRLYLLFPRTVEGEKRFVIGRKVINTWENDFEVEQKRFTESINSRIGFRNNPFDVLKDLKFGEAER